MTYGEEGGKKWAAILGVGFLALAIWVLFGFAELLGYFGQIQNEVNHVQTLKKTCSEKFQKPLDHFYCLREAEAMGQIDVKTTLARVLMLGEGVKVLQDPTGQPPVLGVTYYLAYYDWLIYGAKWATRTAPPVVIEKVFRKIYLKSISEKLAAIPALADPEFAKANSPKDKTEYEALKKQHNEVMARIEAMMAMTWYELLIEGFLQRWNHGVLK